MAIPSETRAEGPVVDFVANLLERLGWRVIRQAVAPGRDNIYAHRGAPLVVFSTHLDTVPPQLPITMDDEAIRGRGACDAKGIAAAMIAAAEQLVAEGEARIGLLFVVDEEDGSAGAIAAAALEPKGMFLINGEPTENRLVTAQKGSCKIILQAQGRAAHSGYPDLGDSAIDRLLDALARIRALVLPVDPVLGPCTINIGKISGGEAPNVVAPSARADILVRLVGPAEPIVAAITRAVGSGIDVTVAGGIPMATAAALPGWESTTVAFASDLAYHGSWGTCYQLGPGSIHVAHTDHEMISTHDLREGVALYVELARTLLRNRPG
ncbi:MAG TPA: M20/M25/M40 family metallo-hydrolase [Gemmatimonadales bacterium]